MSRAWHAWYTKVRAFCALQVLLCDATAVMLRDPLPMLRAAPAAVLLQRDDWPSTAVNELGTAANAGFVWLRGGGDTARAASLVKLVERVVARGLVEFYLRWNNIVDQYPCNGGDGGSCHQGSLSGPPLAASRPGAPCHIRASSSAGPVAPPSPSSCQG